MESTEVVIARLVLGYLKGEKCKSAYREFLKTSNHLQDDMSLAKCKYLPTRFVGLTLEDILSEYFEINKIVQGRLESTNYYNERHSKTSLVHQLLYLLNKTVSSRTSTPCPRSPVDSHLDDTSISPAEHVSDVETTPAHTLPGNIRSTSADSHLYKTPRKKSHSKLNKSTAEVNFPSPDKEDISEVLAQALLENREFHEKIAQTINKVAEKQNRASSELDETVKSVVKETEEDPIFEKILEEIIGSTNMMDCKQGTETSSAPSSLSKNPSDDKWERSERQSHSADEYDTGYRSYTDSQKVAEQNDEAVRSIVANSKLSASKHVDNHKTQENNEVIVFDGSLDKYLRANTCNANTQTQAVQNPLYINTSGGLVMIPSTSVTGNVQRDSSKQYFVVSNQPTINCTAPNIITEQDILSMPTVIVNDTKQATPAKSLVESPSLKTNKKEPPMQQHIVPKPVIEIPNINEYFSFQVALEKYQRGLRNVLYPKSTKNHKPSETTVNSNNTTDTEPPTIKTDIKNEQSNTESFPDEPCDNQKDRPTADNSDNDTHETNATKPELIKNENKTPPLSKPSQKVTPKSGSHVRNLDFSTPPKITSTHKRAMKSRQSSKSPFVHKKSAKNLFKSNDSKLTDKDGDVNKVMDPKLDHKDKVRKLSGTWDADLRAIIPPADETRKRNSKRKRTSPVKKSKKKIRKANNKVEHQLNTTEQDAALLEAALQTPVKTNLENSKAEIITIEDDSATENICESEHENGSEAKTKKNSSQAKIKSDKTNECKLKNKENLEKNPNKLILSPSKLNASKRNLVNTEINAPNLTDGSTDLPIGDTSKFITPEMAKETVNYPIKANRNITPMLETPLKNNCIPKTPRFLTPSNPALDLNASVCSSGFTPFTKMLEANLKGIDINSLPTPSIPITPNFPPFTPTIDLISPYSNRPTDYSTSSSYYQPSDSEQNKSLEANLIELEKKPIVILSDVAIEENFTASTSENVKGVTEGVIIKEQVIITAGSDVKSEISKNDQNKPVCATTVREHLSIFNKNVIGKKNLNLMKRDVSSSSSSSDDFVSETSSNDSSWNGDQSNETVIPKKKEEKKPVETPKRIYSLRNRCTGTASKDEKILKSTDTKETKPDRNRCTGTTSKEEKIHKSTNTKETKPDRKQPDKETKTITKPKPTSKVNTKQCKESTVAPQPDVRIEEEKEKEITKNTGKRLVDMSSFKHDVFKELEEKRLRTINKVKSIQKTPPTKPVKTSKQSKFLKIKPIPNLTNSRRKPRKSASPKKTVQNKTETVISKAPNDGKNGEQREKSPKSRSHNDRDKSVDKTASDVEAQNLIEGLKERGIHLMHNKSPTKKINIPSGDSKVDNDKTETIDDVNSKDNRNSNKSDTSIPICPETTKRELSTSELESEVRDTYDTQVFEGEYECVIFDESRTIAKAVEDYGTVLKKTFIGKVFVEEINAEIDVPLVLSPFISLFDLPSTIDLSATEQMKDLKKDKLTQVKKIGNRIDVQKPATNENGISLIRDVANPTSSDETLKSDDDLMNYAIIGSGKEGTPERPESPQSTRKRKQRSEENSHTEKKCKTLLKNINVDSFLNNIHGGS